jgi:L-threonylcarbamoyladenylate synthase
LIRINTQAAAEAAAFLLHMPGAVLLVPTETVYGLICKADDAAAIDRIYRMKHRDSSKLLGCFAATTDQLSLKPDERVQMLVKKYCPGAITIIAAGEDGSTVGFRIPDHPFLQEILERTGCVLAQTSANRSGRPNALTVDEALAELAEAPDIVVDAGPIPADAQASTVVDASGPELRILRQGKLVITEAISSNTMPKTPPQG